MAAKRDVCGIVEELALDTSISLGRCCRQTMKNWVADINAYLKGNGYGWRVVGRMENREGVLSAITAERYEAINNIK